MTPSVTRRDFIVRSSLVTAAGLCLRTSIFGRAAKSGPPATTPEFTPLRRDVGCFTARGGTIGWW